MKKLLAILACALLTSSSLSAALLRVQTVVSRFADDGKTDLVGAPSVILFNERPARVSLENMDLIMLGTGSIENGLRINARLLKKLGDGKIQRVEVPTTTLELDKPVLVRAEEFQLEFTASLEESSALNVDFPGGPLSELLASMPKNKSVAFNLVGEKEDLATTLPPLSLSFVSPETLVATLNRILNPRGLSISQSRAGNYDPYGRGVVYVLQRAVNPDAGLSPDAPRFRSYPLHDYLTEKQTIDVITDVLRSAWQMLPNAKPEALVLKFHPGTELLLVSGPQEAISVVETVLRKLPATVRVGIGSPADEARRLDQVAEEVRRRRELRQAATSTDTSGDPLDKIEQFIADTERRRAERTAGKPVEKVPAKTTPPEVPQQPQKTADSESAEASKKQLNAISEEIEARRALRKSATETPPPEVPAKPAQK
jgi:hypothetical protein